MNPNTLLKTTTLLIIRLCLPTNGNSQTYSISVNTSTGTDWTVSAEGISGTAPYVVSADLDTGQENLLSVTSDGVSDGSFLSGGSVANFDGFWVADYTFFLPANAIGISLNYGDFYADDRAVLELNGNIFDATGITYFGELNSVGGMVFTDGGPLQPYSSFNSPDGLVSGTVTTGFNPGSVNTIEAIINNTDTGVYGSDRDISSQDATYLGLSGTITYSVPEPPSWAVLGGALGVLGIMKLRDLRYKI